MKYKEAYIGNQSIKLDPTETVVFSNSRPKLSGGHPVRIEQIRVTILDSVNKKRTINAYKIQPLEERSHKHGKQKPTKFEALSRQQKRRKFDKDPNHRKDKERQKSIRKHKRR